MAKVADNRRRRERRHRSLRNKIEGTPERPRLCVYRSLKHVYAQVVDDLGGKTLAAANTRMKEVQDAVVSTGSREAAVAVGKLIAEKAKAAGVERVCFDRGGRKYHGRVKALAEAAREAGLQF